MCIFVGHFGFLNFDLGAWGGGGGGGGVQIRNQQLCKLSSTEFHQNQITFGISVRHIRSGSPSCPRGPSYFTFRYYI